MARLARSVTGPYSVRFGRVSARAVRDQPLVGRGFCCRGRVVTAGWVSVVSGEGHIIAWCPLHCAVCVLKGMCGEIQPSLSA